MRPRQPSGKFQELGGQELEELIEIDQPDAPFDESYDEEPTVADDVIPAHRGTPPPRDGVRTGPGLAHEKTAQIASDIINTPHSISVDLSDPEPGVGETAAIRRVPHPSPAPEAVTPGPRSPGQAQSARPRRRTDSQEMVDEMLGQILGSHRVISLLGEGGMGRVYMAEHIKLSRKVALKLLRPEYAVKKDAVRRFFQEARAVNKIGHENIVDIEDYQELDNGTFIIMELLQGEDLADVQRKLDTPMPLHRAMRIATQVCDALVAAHKEGVVHRDLKPDNIFIVNTDSKRDFVKLLDFGVAKLFNEENDGWQTAVGSVIGTPAYMSPEQATGIPVDHRSDIYSLGAIMYEVFTGHPVFRAKSFGEFVVKHMNDEPVPPRDLAGAPKIPASLEMVILRCLEKDPDKRYQTVEDLRDDLSRATATVETAIKPNPLIAARGEGKKKSPHKWIIIPMGLAITAMAVLAFLLASGFFETTPDPPSVLPTTRPAPGKRPRAAVDEKQPAPGAVAQPNSEPVPKVEQVEATPHKGSIILKLHTQPKGAEVFRKDRPGRSLGRTPLNLVLGKVGEEITFVFRLKNFVDHVEQVKVAEDNALVFVALERRLSKPVPAAQPKPEPVVRLKTAPAKKATRVVRKRPPRSKARPASKVSRNKPKPAPKAKAKTKAKTKTKKPVPSKKIQLDPFDNP